MATALGALIVQSCLLPEVELSDEPAQGQGNLIGQGGNASTASGSDGSAAGGGSSVGGSFSAGTGGSLAMGGGGSSSAGSGGSLATGTGGSSSAGTDDAPLPTDLMPGGSGGSTNTPPIMPVASCDNGSLDTNESDVDCGGSCAACANGAACAANADCSSGRCTDGLCAAAASCQDGILNQDETGIDCGGSACSARCAASQTCRADGDCTGGLSCPAGVCVAPSCSDGIQNQGESAVDCGGPCALCAPGRACTSAAQCSTNLCGTGGCPAGVARCCQPDPCPNPVVCDAGDRRCSDDDDSLEQCNECQDGFEVIEECTLRCLSIAGTFVCDLPGLPNLPGLPL